MISFNSIPLDLRTGGQYVEFDPSRAVRGLALKPHKILIVGQKLAAGSAAGGVPVRVSSVDQAIVAFGRGSMLSRMILAAKANTALTEIWALPLVDLAGGTAATGTLTITGPSTAAGTIALLIAGQRIPIGVSSGQSATAIATALAAAVNAAADLPVTAAAVAAVVTLTARHKGECGNGIDARVNYYVGEALPAGVGVAVVAMSGGAGNPDASVVFTAIGDTPFDTIIHPYTDAANLTAIETALATRWGPMKAIDGVAFTAATGSLGTMTALGNGRNSPYSTILPYKSAPTPTWEWAAAFGVVVGDAGAIDPARPFQTLPLLGVLGPVITDQWTHDERESLLRDGMSTFTVDSGGVVVLERPVTTYQTNALAQPDVTFLDVNTVLILSYMRYTIRARVGSKYPRHKLGNDGTNYAPGQAIVTPNVLRAEAVGWAQDLERVGIIEDIEQFKADLFMERDASSTDRVNARFSPNLVNAFRTFAAQIQFIL